MPDDATDDELLQEAVDFRELVVHDWSGPMAPFAHDLMQRGLADFNQQLQRLDEHGNVVGATAERDLAELMDTGAPEPDPEALAREEALHRDRLLRQYDPEGLQDPEWVLTYADAFDRQKDAEYYADVAEGLTPKIYSPDELATAALDWLGENPTGLSVRQGFERKKREEAAAKQAQVAAATERSGGVPLLATKIAESRWVDGRELPARATMVDMRTGQETDVRLDDPVPGMPGYVVSNISAAMGVELLASEGGEQPDFLVAPTIPERSR